VFVLGGIITGEEYASGHMDRELRDFKKRVFGRDDLILHTADIVRNKNGFESLKQEDLREFFYRELNDLMIRLEYMVVACAILKEPYLQRYGAKAFDPYEAALGVLVERFCYELKGSSCTGRIIAEARSPELDRMLRRAWETLRSKGTHYVGPDEISRRITRLDCCSKSENIAGLQVADLVVSPIGRHVIGKSPKPDFRIIESKFRCRKGTYRGSGLIVLPGKEES
jgi:hypothetical protein